MTADSTEIAQTILRVIREEKPHTVEQLVVLAREKLQASEQEVLKVVTELQSEGKITLSSQQIPASLKLAAFLKTAQAVWYWATISVAILTAIVVFMIPEDLHPLVYIRYLMGMIFALWLPGYAFTKALFPSSASHKNSEKSLDTIERITLSIGLSLALVPLVGLLLNYSPWGIRLVPIVFSLLVLTIVFATAGIIREHQTKTH